MAELLVKTTAGRRRVVARAATTLNERVPVVDSFENSIIIHTGSVSLSGSSDSALLFFENNEPETNGTTDLVVKRVDFGLGVRTATVTNHALFTVIANPSGGDIVTDATDAAIISQSDFSSAISLAATTKAFKGKDGGTITGGTTFTSVFLSEGHQRLDTGILLPNGATLGVKVDLNTSGNAEVYAILTISRRNGEV